MNTRLSMVLVGAALLLILSGCVPGAAVNEPTDLPATNPPTAQVNGQEPTIPAEESSTVPEPTATEDTRQENAEPTARVGLQATDPETVMLGSGDIQLVEFFAFW